MHGVGAAPGRAVTDIGATTSAGQLVERARRRRAREDHADRFSCLATNILYYESFVVFPVELVTVVSGVRGLSLRARRPAAARLAFGFSLLGLPALAGQPHSPWDGFGA